MAQQAANAAAALRQQMLEAEADDPLLAHFSEPKCFAELLEATGLPERKLRMKIDELWRAGKVERWDLPRFVRTDLTDHEKQILLKEMIRQTPLGQRAAEAVTGLRRGQVSTVLSANKQHEAERLGNKKGDPWFIARGTERNEPQQISEAAPESAGRYRSHRSHRDPTDAEPPKRRSRRSTRGGVT